MPSRDAPMLSRTLMYFNLRERYVFLLSALTIILFNYFPLSLHILVIDDLDFYGKIVEGSFKISFNRALVVPVLNYFFAHLLPFSPPFARAIHIFLGMIPLSLMLYFLYTRYFNLPRSLSLFAAVIPQILPGQLHIPAYVLGSYMIYGLLFFTTSIFLSIKYLQSHRIFFAIASCLAYFLSVQVTEVAVFLIFPLFVLLISRFAFDKRLVLLSLSLSAISIYTLLHTVLHPFGHVNRPEIYGLATILERGEKMLKWILPLPHMSALPMGALLFALIVAAGFFSALIRSSFLSSTNLGASDSRRFGNTSDVLSSYLYGFSWLLFAALPFAFSHYLVTYYLYPAAFGSAFLIALSIDSLIPRTRLAGFFLFIAITAFTISVGITRVQAVHKFFDQKELTHLALKKALSDHNFPRHSQLVIVGIPTNLLYTASKWDRSCGYLRYVTGRTDISGLVGSENTFYDPFAKNERGYSFIMRGLDISAPLFLFRFERDVLIPIEYCLQWKSSEAGVNWTIFELDLKQGSVVTLRSGNSQASFRSTVEELDTEGISIANIMWAG